MYLVQILLPLYDNEGQPQSRDLFRQVRRELTEEFEGLTVYSRAPAEGLWESESEDLQRDDVVLFEVVVDFLDAKWWQGYRQSLETRFKQQSIMARAQEIQRL